MEVTVQVCDVCQVVGKPVETYSVGQGSRAAKPVLCADDSKPLEFFLPQAGRARVAPPAAKKAATKKAARAPRGGRQSGIATLEEIEAEKRRG